MQRLDLTLDAVMNIALDDALIETAENVDDHPEVLRFWEPEDPIVVIGRSSPLSTEVNHEFCRDNQITVVRRVSGGQSIVAGPGCLMYALLLDMRLRPELRSLDQAHRIVIEAMQEAISSLGVETQMQGTCDLTFNGRKFSGNAVRCRRNWMLYHGTVLCDFDLDLIENCLGTPIRQPEYRQQRSHADFVSRIPVSTRAVADALAQQWQATDRFEAVPIELAESLKQEKYLTEEWLAKVP